MARNPNFTYDLSLVLLGVALGGAIGAAIEGSSSRRRREADLTTRKLMEIEREVFKDRHTERPIPVRMVDE